MKLLFDLFPIALFFIAFRLRGIFFATAIAIAASFAQIAWAYFRRRKVEPMLWVSLSVIVVFGGATLLFQNETFIKWKPTVLYWIFGAALLGSDLVFRKNLIRAMLSKQMDASPAVWRNLNLSWAAFFAVLGCVNLFVANRFSTAVWVNFKVFGTTAIIVVFILIQALALSRYAKPNDATDGR